VSRGERSQEPLLGDAGVCFSGFRSVGSCLSAGVSVERGRPFGEEEWVKRTERELSLGHTVRP